MCATAANLMECVLPPESGLRQWVLTFPFAWRATRARNGALLGSLTRVFEQTVQSFYKHRARMEGRAGAKTGWVAILQRTSADLRLNPHVHAVFLDGAWYEQGDELATSPDESRRRGSVFGQPISPSSHQGVHAETCSFHLCAPAPRLMLMMSAPPPPSASGVAA